MLMILKVHLLKMPLPSYQKGKKRLRMLLEQPHKAAESIAQFSREFEARLGLARR